MTPATPEDRELQVVLEVPGRTASQLYAKTLAWMAETFVSSKAVIELQDKENAKIIGHGRTSFTNVIAVIPCEYTLIAEMKDGRVRLTFKDFVGQWGEYHNHPVPVEEAGFAREVKQNLAPLSKSLEGYLTKPETKW